MLPTNLASMLPTAEEFHDFARSQVAWITNCLADGDHDEWTPQMMVQVFDPKDGSKSLEILSLHVPFNSDDEKRLAMTSLATNLYFRQKIPLMACLSSEGWQSMNTPKGMRPADDPFRKEVVILFGMTVHHLSCVTSAPISRPAGKIVASEFGDLRTENVRTQLLQQFFAAFMRPIAHKFQDASH